MKTPENVLCKFAGAIPPGQTRACGTRTAGELYIMPWGNTKASDVGRICRKCSAAVKADQLKHGRRNEVTVADVALVESFREIGRTNGEGLVIKDGACSRPGCGNPLPELGVNAIRFGQKIGRVCNHCHPASLIAAARYSDRRLASKNIAEVRREAEEEARLAREKADQRTAAAGEETDLQTPPDSWLGWEVLASISRERKPAVNIPADSEGKGTQDRVPNGELRDPRGARRSA
jgi:hypothetical protein